MDQSAFDAADRHLDGIAESLDQALLAPELQMLRGSLAALGTALGPRYSVSLNCVVEVFDQQKERTLPLLNTGLSTSAGSEPFRIDGDCTPQRYLVDGEIQVVPHDRRPRCWDRRDFKWQHHRCPQCGAELGANTRILLDSDRCPHCEKGKVTARQPRCSQCGFEVDPSLVSWG
jgi:hypothetical protein